MVNLEKLEKIRKKLPKKMKILIMMKKIYLKQNYFNIENIPKKNREKLIKMMMNLNQLIMIIYKNLNIYYIIFIIYKII